MPDRLQVPLNERRVSHLLELLRKRTPHEIGLAMIFAPAFTMEMASFRIAAPRARLLDQERSKERPLFCSASRFCDTTLPKVG